MNKKNNQKSKKLKSFLLMELLENFSASELEGLERIVNCTYFNTDKYIVKLLNALKQNIRRKRSLNEEEIVKIHYKVFESVSTKKTLSSQQQATFRVKMSALMRLAERFLMIEALDADTTSQTKLLQEKILEKKQFRLFERDIKKRKKQLEGQIKDLDYYAHLYRIETGELNYLYRSGKWIKEDNLPELTQSLEVYYLLNRLNLHLTELSFMETSAQKLYDFSSMPTVQALSDLPKYAKLPLVQVYNTAIQLIQGKNYDTYTQLLDLLASNEESISLSNLNDFYVVLINFCIQQIKRGHTEYYRQLFDLYGTMDKRSLLLEGGAMTLIKLRNVVSTACRVGEFDWAIQIIDKYYPFIRKDVQEDVRNFNLGAVEFYKKNYAVAIDYLYGLGNINLNYDLNRRMMMLKSYYEMETEYKETTAQVFRSIEKYIQEHKSLTAMNKTAYKNFVRLLINLYRVRHREGKMTLESIKNKLEKSEFISDKSWLVKKIQELE